MAKTDRDARRTKLAQADKLWWHNADLQAFARDVLDHPEGRTEFSLDDLMFRVVPTGAVAESHEGGGPYNFTHVCPPNCP